MQDIIKTLATVPVATLPSPGEKQFVYPLLYINKTIVIRKRETTDNGDIAVILVNNRKMTEKVFDDIILDAENRNTILYFSAKNKLETKSKIIGKAVESRKKL